MHRFRFVLSILLISFAFLALGGCATAPKQEAGGAIFYPPLPNPPRIQYLATFSSAADLGKGQSGFAEFVVGEDPKARMSVKKPYGVAIYDGKIYVVDMGAGGYAVFDLKAKKMDMISGDGGGKMAKPINMTIDTDGVKYVTDTGLNQVLAFDKQEKFVRAYGVKDQFKPSGVAVSGNRLYVSDLKEHKIFVLDKGTGNTLFEIGKAGKGEGELHYPTNMVIGPDNYLYVTEIGNFRVQKFTLDGQTVHCYGDIGDVPGSFTRPKGVAVDREGHIYTVDAAFENVQILNQAGRILLFFGGPGGHREDINLPTAMVIDYNSAPLFQKYADPRFKVEYVILIASQFGHNAVNVYGYGKIDGMDYTEKEPPAPPAKPEAKSDAKPPEAKPAN
jgi:DNA-binding beta-propeller fold protein YncE